MPNGGSDCCATCWFNERNEGKAGFLPTSRLSPATCTIRGASVARPSYTYCGNHPHRRPKRDPIPIGPLFTGDASGERRIAALSPDNEVIRTHLLDLLRMMKQTPRSEYPMGFQSDEVVVWQLGEFREARAEKGLRIVASFDPDASESGPFGRTRSSLVELAREALTKIGKKP